MTRHLSGILCLIIPGLLIAPLHAQEDDDEYIPKAGEFPPPDSGHYLSGEMVALDHVNRMASIRLAGTGVENLYHSAPAHQFAMLPYGAVRFHGAAAALRDIPIGTNLHGTFYLPPEGNDLVPPFPERSKKYETPWTHAFLIEDDVSFYQRQGITWKIAELNVEEGTIRLTPQGGETEHGLNVEESSLFIDPSTRVWKGREFASLSDLAVDQEILFNLSWAPSWVYGGYYCTDLWIGPESLQPATEQQRQRNIHHIHHRWMPAMVNHVEHQAEGRGVITATLLGGQDDSLYEEFLAQEGKSVKAAAAEWTLRTWWQDHDGRGGKVLEVTRAENPPAGSSGVQIRFEVHPLLEGFRPDRFIRIRCDDWPNVKLPPEERVSNMAERQ